ncbi:MAG: ABC transporter substrate-binding protein, partial [Thermodesulfobacteriota bacterium]|nr:ABC transporter substrate-binding protein [Thermodesulfobacteriota bacterium]
RCSIPAGIAAFKKLLFKDEIFALTGPAHIGTAKALFGQIEKLKIPNISGAPDEAQLSPLKRHIFMPFNVYDDQLGLISDYIVNDLKPKKIDITFIYWDSESGKVALRSAQKWAKFFNFSLSNTEIINMGALDAASQVISIRRNKPTHILIHHTSPGTIVLLRDLRKFGLHTPVYGTMTTCLEDVVRMGGSASRNYRGASPFSSWYDDGKGVEKMRRITLKYKPGTEMPYRNKWYTLGWIIGTIYHEGLNRAGRDLSIEGFVTALESIRDMNTGGLSGPISFSPTNHQAMHRTKLYRADPESQKLVPIIDWRKTPEIK